MKKAMFLGSFFALSLAVSPVWADSPRSNGSEANATAVQATTVNVVTPAPQINNTSNSNTTVGVGINNSPSNSVGINNSPTNNNQSGVSNSGNSGSFSQGGAAQASVDKSGNSTLILDQSQKNEYQNRQHIGTPGVAAAPAAQMFDAWEQGSWNVSPITAGALEGQTLSKEKIEFVKFSERFFVKGDPASKIVLRGTLFSQADKKTYYVPPSGKKVGTMSMVMPEDRTVDDALLYAAAIGMANGADQIEVIQYGGRKMPTVEGWSVGVGSGASGLMGNTEAIAVAAGGGTNFSKSSVVKEEQPWLSVVFWKNGYDSKQTIKVAPVKEEPSVKKLDKQKSIQ